MKSKLEMTIRWYLFCVYNYSGNEDRLPRLEKKLATRLYRHLDLTWGINKVLPIWLDCYGGEGLDGLPAPVVAVMKSYRPESALNS